ncbi:hypothetical protein DFR74_1527 [Nocardia puris]|uniref:Uncharacterized protein n=1 Tax=Nocardia puris TaxID=208602 RepID=A0A366CU21_9NOCA|nr:hypothetical protein DFR74_1527 [Nocardia puris]
MTVAEPITYTTTRHRCPFCRYSRTRRASTAAHIGRCRVYELREVGDRG